MVQIRPRSSSSLLSVLSSSSSSTKKRCYVKIGFCGFIVAIGCFLYLIIRQNSSLSNESHALGLVDQTTLQQPKLLLPPPPHQQRRQEQQQQQQQQQQQNPLRSEEQQGQEKNSQQPPLPQQARARYEPPGALNPLQSSRTATVMGMATGYPVSIYQQFVGSLRATGYEGNIILAISPEPLPRVEDYLRQERVIMKRLTFVPCTTNILKGKTPTNSHAKEIMTCANPYPELKVRWGRFALLRDYLEECQECTGPVLVADVRDTFFQRDPFGPEAPPVVGLQLAEEYRKMRTTHWLVKIPVEKCKHIKIFDEPMLCSGTTIGTRQAMLDYLQIMVDEMRLWMKDPNCCCNAMNGDDQSIHNYLYYTGKLPFATVMKNRVGLVNTVGGQGAMIHNIHRDAKLKQLNLTIVDDQYDGANLAKGQWIGLHYDLTDTEGYLVQFDGTRSYIIHQYDRFGAPLQSWVQSKVPQWIAQSSVRKLPPPEAAANNP